MKYYIKIRELLSLQEDFDGNLMEGKDFFGLEMDKIPDFLLPILRLILGFCWDDSYLDSLLYELKWSTKEDGLMKFAKNRNWIMSTFMVFIRNPELEVSYRKRRALRDYMELYKGALEMIEWKKIACEIPYYCSLIVKHTLDLLDVIPKRPVELRKSIKRRSISVNLDDTDFKKNNQNKKQNKSKFGPKRESGTHLVRTITKGGKSERWI